MWSQYLSQVLPVLIDVLTPAIAALIAALIYRWTGVQVEQKHMLALQSALQNGARLLLANGKTVEDAIDYVEKSVPDALAKFKVEDRFRIEELLTPHIAALSSHVPINGFSDLRHRMLGLQPEPSNDL